MLRNRIRTVTNNTKQALMADQSPQSSSSSSSSSPTQKKNYKKPTSHFLFSSSSRFIKAFTSESGVLISSTSVLETKNTNPYSPFGHNPFYYGKKNQQHKSPKTFSETKQYSSDATGIALLLTDHHNTLKAEKVLLGNKVVKVESRPSFGTENGNSVSRDIKFSVNEMKLTEEYTCVISHGPSPRTTHIFDNSLKAEKVMFCNKVVKVESRPGFGTENGNSVPRDIKFSVNEMKLSEEYTCVISHGPNPRTTHIFFNCVVESCCSSFSDESNFQRHFLSFCHTCKKNLEQKNDIYIYGGDRAFCSCECRYKEMVLDGVDNFST